jgi:hypothetical protein
MPHIPDIENSWLSAGLVPLPVSREGQDRPFTSYTKIEKLSFDPLTVWLMTIRLLCSVKSQRQSQIACQIPDFGIYVESGRSELARGGHELCAQSGNNRIKISSPVAPTRRPVLPVNNVAVI